MLNNQNEATNLEKIEEKIQEEELSLLKKIFQNKTIIFEDIFERKTQKRLVIVDDEFVNWIPIELSIAYAASPIGFPIGLPIRLSTAQIELPIGHAITHATGILIERPIAHAIDVIGVLIGDAIDVIGVLIRDAIAHAIDAIGILIGDTIRILIVITILRLATKSLLMRIIYIYNLLNRY